MTDPIPQAPPWAGCRPIDRLYRELDRIGWAKAEGDSSIEDLRVQLREAVDTETAELDRDELVDLVHLLSGLLAERIAWLARSTTP
jgi:hypothetical protein